MKKFLPYLTLLFAIAGFVLLFFEAKLIMPIYLIFVLVPIALITTILILRQELQEIDLGFRLSFIVISILIPLCIVLGILCRTQHYPGAGPLFLLSDLLCAIQLVLGLIYLIQKRKAIQSPLIYVLVLLFLPFFITIWFQIPTTRSSLDTKHNLALWETTKIMGINNYSRLKDLDSLSLKRYQEISEIRSNAIKWTGGYDEKGIPNCLTCLDIGSFRYHLALDSSYVDSNFIRLVDEAQTLSELNLILTEIQTSLILENTK